MWRQDWIAGYEGLVCGAAAREVEAELGVGFRAQDLTEAGAVGGGRPAALSALEAADVATVEHDHEVVRAVEVGVYRFGEFCARHRPTRFAGRRCEQSGAPQSVVWFSA